MRATRNQLFGIIIHLIIISLLLPAQAYNSYTSILEMRDNIPSTWTENLKGGKKDFDCAVDAFIVVPDVERFPILSVGYQGMIPGLEETGYSIEKNTEQETVVEKEPDDATEYTGSSKISVFYEDSMTAETIASIEDKAEELLQKVWDMNGTSLEKLGITVYRTEDEAYQATSVEYCPVYNGIAYLKCPQSLVGVKNYVERPFNYVDAFWQEDGYEAAIFHIPSLIGESLPDVPLLPFADIQEIIRQRIHEGYVQSVDEIRLGYMCCNNPEQPGENFYLTPAWVVCGVMNSDPNLPFYPDDYTPAQRYRSSKITINAQTGEIIDINSHSKETFDAHILTWDDVKK